MALNTRALKKKVKGMNNSSYNINLISKFAFRFWSYVELFGVMLILWPFEIHSWHSYGDELFITELLKTLSAATIFAIFVLNKKVRGLLFEPYQRMRNTSTVVSEEI
jgi:hypothetical protein